MTVPRSKAAETARLQGMTRDERKDMVFLNIAHRLAGLSTCDRKQVGAVITWLGRCVSWGFNGAPPGMPHCEENYHGYMPGFLPGHEDEDEVAFNKNLLEMDGCRNATHAEANALAFAAREGISTEGGTLYVTVSPCEVCARLLIAAGIVRVVYAEEYRDAKGVEILHAALISAGELRNS